MKLMCWLLFGFIVSRLLSARLTSKSKNLKQKSTDISTYSQYLLNPNYGWEEHQTLSQISVLMKFKQMGHLETIQKIYTQILPQNNFKIKKLDGTCSN